MRASEIMSADPVCCTPSETIQQAAKVMADCDCGCVPVVADADRKRVVGVITDRDIAVRAVAKGQSFDAKISDVMTNAPSCCSADDDIGAVERTMTEQQVRRVIIVDDNQCCVGIISQADLARAAERRTDVSEHDLAQVVERISEPRSSRRT